MTKRQPQRNNRGIALLIVLFVTMAIVLVSLSFLYRCYMLLAAGSNTHIRGQMDMLAYSGLEHAKAYLMNPEETTGASQDYWPGDTDLQLDTNSNDYYDLTITPSGTDPGDQFEYQVEVEAYRLIGGDISTRGGLSADIRLDPVFSLWMGASAVVPASMSVEGDVYCSGNLINSGVISGDVYADSLTGSADGQRYDTAENSVTWPGLETDIFTGTYYIDSSSYAADTIAPGEHTNLSKVPMMWNLGGVYTCSGDLVLNGGANITGTLVVDGNLTIKGQDNQFRRLSSFPAMVVTGTIEVFDDADMQVEGLIQCSDFTVGSGDCDISIEGAVFIENNGLSVNPLHTGWIYIQGHPKTGSVQVFPTLGTSSNWNPIGGAFFKNVSNR